MSLANVENHQNKAYVNNISMDLIYLMLLTNFPNPHTRRIYCCTSAIARAARESIEHYFWVIGLPRAL